MARFGRSTTADEVLAGLDLRGRVLLVTGATAGIGFETARALGAHGATVFLASRDAAGGHRVADAVRRAHPGADVRALALDLASLRTVRQAAADLPGHLHGIVANAGVYGPYAETADGFERTVGVCHLGHFALVQALLDRLRAGAPARVVFVSSESHRYPRTLDFARFPSKKERYKPMIAYGQAKLCNVLTANELTRRHGRDGVFGNSLHPGTLVRTSIGRNSLLAQLVLSVAAPFTKNIAQAAATSVYCAVHPDLDGVGGKYFVDCIEKQASDGAMSREAQHQLWELSLEWAGMR
jgi:WW domain-containing oxidoreductase